MHRCRNTASLLKESGYRYESFSAFFFWVSRSTASLFPRGTRRTRQRSHSVWPFWRGGVPWGVPWILFVVVLPSAPSIGRGECLRAKVDGWQFQARDVEILRSTIPRLQALAVKHAASHRCSLSNPRPSWRAECITTMQGADVTAPCNHPFSHPDLPLRLCLMLLSFLPFLSLGLAANKCPRMFPTHVSRPGGLHTAVDVGDMVICGRRKDGEISSARVAARTTIKLGNGKHNAGCSR